MKGQRSKKVNEDFEKRNLEIKRMFIDGYSQYAISKMYNLSRERIRQIIKKQGCG